MKTKKNQLGFLLTIAMFLFCLQVEAQRMGHGASRGGGGGRVGGGGGGVQHNAGGGGGGAQRSSINGGSVKSPDRQVRTNPSNKGNNRDMNNRDNNNNTINNNSGNRTNNSNNRNSNNRVNTGDVNININNSHNVNNTVVRRNNIATYPRAPYAWGGRRYYCYHPYVYHPFHPFYWGPVYHPWGFFVAALATTAIVVSVANAQYHYDQGVWYSASTYYQPVKVDGKDKYEVSQVEEGDK